MEVYPHKIFSIVVPIYNTSIDKFNNMLSSILNQSCESIELILVDDGSTSDISVYLDGLNLNIDYCVIHQKNKGLSGARNTGIKAACGDYLIFIDADDQISSDMIAEATEYIEKYKPDVIYSYMVLFKESVNGIERLRANNCTGNDLLFYHKTLRQKSDCATFYNSNNDIEELKARLLDFPYERDFILLGSACATVFKADIFKKLVFDESVFICEDQVFNRSVLQIINNCLVVPNEWYYYIQYSSSMLHDQGKDINVEKTIGFWNAIFDIDEKESKYIQSISNGHNISLFCDDLRNLALSGIRYNAAKNKIYKLYNHKLIKKAKLEKCLYNSRNSSFKGFLVRHGLIKLLFFLYQIREKVN